ncbi:Uu.00g061330.m01.CDS01 [Anthostomella pinea]|uniref:Uu.00g061330.m01.CDS01 n=1 Tax=Anthostomella pinea TaxID=933095 RepID=A0AAI8YME8_9PEZI|nr:Uu.00g061330.m01.CDS01 [Anthostomella pinea]
MESHRNPTILVNSSSWPVAILATVFLALRIWCRAYLHSGLWYDDYLLIASLVALLLTCSLQSAMFAEGFGQDILATGLPASLFSAAFSMAALSTAWSKTAFAITLLSITKRKVAKAFLWFSILGLNVICYMFAVGVWAKSCESKDSKGFANAVLPGACWKADVFRQLMYVQATYSGLMDLALAFFPWIIIWKIKLRVQDRIGLSVAMSLGVVACVVVVVRIVLLTETNGAFDYTYVVGKICVTNVAEPATTILAQSIPVFRALLRGSRSEHRISTGTSEVEQAWPRESETPSARATPEDPYGIFNDDADIHLHLIKRPDGRIVLASAPDEPPPPPSPAVCRSGRRRPL